MKRILIIILIFLGICYPYSLKAQSTVGTDFWVTFLPNSNNSGVELSLIATGERDCSGTITNYRTGWSTNFNVYSEEITSINIPISQSYDYLASDKKINTALHIVTTDSISLYASNFHYMSFDVTNVLPTSALGSEYILQTYNEGSEFSIIATEDNTTVEINLSCNSINGHIANQPFTITLNTGQCYQVQSNNNGPIFKGMVDTNNFSGTQISAYDNKKVAVFAGNLCTLIPDEYGACDHINEQMLPTSCWGNEFIVTGSELRTYDRIRITAMNNNTTVKKDGSILTRLNERETYEDEITDSNPAIYLESDEPIMVCLYFTGAYYGGSMGDPSMVNINPIQQKINNITFSTFESSEGYCESHYVNIITHTENVNSMILDGSNISSQFDIVPSNPDYSYARISINHDSHNLTNTSTDGNCGFIAHVYGLGSKESYSYSVGSMAINLTSQLIIDGLSSFEHPNGFDYCADNNNEINFDLNLNYTPTDVVWDFGDGNTGNGLPITHQYSNAGDYNVVCKVYKLENDVSTLVSTLTTSVHIHDIQTSNITDVICVGDSYLDNGFSIVSPEAGNYIDSVTYTSIYGCDSIVKLNLSVAENYSFDVYDTICEGDYYQLYGLNINNPGLGSHEYTSNISSSYGCDSLFNVSLEVLKTYDEIAINGMDNILASTNLVTGCYKFYIDSIENCNQYNWYIENPEWLIYPNNNECLVVATTPINNTLYVSATNTCGTVSDFIELNAGFIGDQNNSRVTMYPNPVKDFVNIQQVDITKISVYDSYGQLVMRKEYNFDSHVTLDFSSLESSIYIIEIITLDKTYVERISIVK